jgi:hypothetical protein
VPHLYKISLNIYPKHNQRPLRSPGSVLEVRGRLGRTKVVTWPDATVSFSSLLREGYDSVHLTGCFGSGDEYIVYNSDQAEPVRIVR